MKEKTTPQVINRFRDLNLIDEDVADNLEQSIRDIYKEEHRKTKNEFSRKITELAHSDVTVNKAIEILRSRFSLPQSLHSLH